MGSWVLRTWFPSAWSWRNWRRVCPQIPTRLFLPALWPRSRAPPSHQVRGKSLGGFDQNRWSSYLGWHFAKKLLFSELQRSLSLSWVLLKTRTPQSNMARKFQNRKWVLFFSLHPSLSFSSSLMSYPCPHHYLTAHISSSSDTVKLRHLWTLPSTNFHCSSSCFPVCVSLGSLPVPRQRLHLRRRLTARRARPAQRRKQEMKGTEPSRPLRRPSHLPTPRSLLPNSQSYQPVKARLEVSAAWWLAVIFIILLLCLITSFCRHSWAQQGTRKVLRKRRYWFSFDKNWRQRK